MYPQSILLVDDSDDFLNLLELWIQKKYPTCRISKAKSCSEALENSVNQDFDLVITDYLLDGEKGTDIVNLYQDSYAKVLVITGCSEDEVRADVPDNITILNKYSSMNSGKFLSFIDSLHTPELELFRFE